nr:unnamed protein product [Callosobruchus chinensis]
MGDETRMQIPSNFEFPFPPYSIQKEFMEKLYYVLENKKLGIFESPTGTGKSLSIICGAIKWLKDHQKFELEQLKKEVSQLQSQKQELALSTTDWLISQSKEIELTQQLYQLKLQATNIEEYNKKLDDIRKFKQSNLRKNWTKASTVTDKSVNELVPEKAHDDNLDDLLPEDDTLNDKMVETKIEEIEDKYEPIKIYICSRTHSQLAQFVGEIMKSPYGDNIRVTSLASRQSYCINPAVQTLKNVSLINERCLDMQKKEKQREKTDKDNRTVKKSKGCNNSCPYFRQAGIENLRNVALSNVLDVEDLVSCGKDLQACPYYGSRKAAEDAEVILIPYNTLLHKATREANGIRLENNIVIIDEAHNLLDALEQMHAVVLSYGHLYHAFHQMRSYKEKFSNRFSAKNLLMINQVTFVINQLLSMIDSGTIDVTEIFTISNFISTAKIDNYNIFKLVSFCKDARMAQKIRSYTIKFPIVEAAINKPKVSGLKTFLASIENKKSIPQAPEPKEEDHKIPVVGNPLLAVISFLETLTQSCDDGRILVRRGTNKSQHQFQFLLLNPSTRFEDIVKNARSVVVAGGTMKPMAEFRDRLFINAGAAPDRIVEFSCDHIVPAENILPIVMTKGADKENLLFNFEKRMTMGSSLKKIILEACKVVRGGIVVFFPSYNYENWVWQQMKDLQFGRAVFREPQSASMVDSVLRKYEDAINKSHSKGALLFSVVGGKLSEGLNFSDDLGRCVIVVGLPYPNIKAVDLKEKMAYLDRTEGLGAGQKFYENQCMKAVNQCIGRAVRHKNDYATVLLLDERYNRMSVKNSLPNWIKRCLKMYEYKETFLQIVQFFDQR